MQLLDQTQVHFQGRVYYVSSLNMAKNQLSAAPQIDNHAYYATTPIPICEAMNLFSIQFILSQIYSNKSLITWPRTGTAVNLSWLNSESFIYLFFTSNKWNN